MTRVVRSAPQYPVEVVGWTPDLDFYLLCEPICVSLRLFLGILVFINTDELSVFDVVMLSILL
jgi:hypothetical protein